MPVCVCVCVCVAKPVAVELRCHATALILVIQASYAVMRQLLLIYNLFTKASVG